MALATTGFAIHQMKRDPLFRKVVVPDTNDELIVEFDFAGQEFRLMAECSKDETMIALCQPGHDAHSYMGAAIGNVDYHDLIRRVHEGDKAAKELRQLGKTGNLALGYRTSAATLKVRAKTDYGLTLELALCEHIHRTYQRSYPGVPVYWKHQIRLGRAHGYVTTLAGRRVNVGKVDSWEEASTCINFPVQGSGADQKYLALYVIRDYLKRQHWPARFLFDLHDGLYFSVNKRVAEKFALEGKYLLSNLPYEKMWEYAPQVAFPVDCKIGPSWGELKEFS